MLEIPRKTEPSQVYLKISILKIEYKYIIISKNFSLQKGNLNMLQNCSIQSQTILDTSTWILLLEGHNYLIRTQSVDRESDIFWMKISYWILFRWRDRWRSETGMTLKSEKIPINISFLVCQKNKILKKTQSPFLDSCPTFSGTLRFADLRDHCGISIQAKFSLKYLEQFWQMINYR